jgi:hypothetical protein
LEEIVVFMDNSIIYLGAQSACGPDGRLIRDFTIKVRSDRMHEIVVGGRKVVPHSQMCAGIKRKKGRCSVLPQRDVGFEILELKARKFSQHISSPAHSSSVAQGGKASGVRLVAFWLVGN